MLILDAQSGTVVRSGRASHPEGTEVDPAAWWNALTAALEDAGGIADVVAISIAGQQHGMVLLDGNGNVVREALLWNDTRSATAAADLVTELGTAALVSRSGSLPVASLTSTKVRWVRDNEPQNVAKIAAVALPHDWLSWRLRGFGPVGLSPLGPNLDQLTTDASDASGTGYWSPAAGRYDLELFEHALGRSAREADPAQQSQVRTTDVILPKVLGPEVAIGNVHPSYAEGNAEVLMGVGAGDNAGGALGLGAQLGDVVVSVGTSGTVYAISEVPAQDSTGTVAGFSDASGAFLPIAVTLNAARVLTSTARLLGVDLEEFSDLALEADPGASGVVLLPYFEGERTPNLPHAKASFHGLSIASTTRENLARAAVEGMLCGLAQGLQALKSNGVQARRVMLIGGAVQSPAVQEIAAQVFDVPVQIPAPDEYVARGAAVQAAWALTGERPEWPLEMAATPQARFVPAIMEQYSEVADNGNESGMRY